ncbi:MAG: hypothetical protein O3A51_04560 [Verrucomicrobia bacterium]|nr:hypothetical protein [Verrucomicrobiota bacterium]
MTRESHNAPGQNRDDGDADPDLVLELNFVPDWARKPAASSTIVVRRTDGSKPNNRDRRPERRDRGPRPAAGGSGRSDRRPDRRDRSPSSPRIPLPHLQVRFLPDDRQLATIIKKMRTSGRAYPLPELVALFLSKPEACRVKLERQANEPAFHQCRSCGAVTLTRDTMTTHLLHHHLDDVFDITTEIGEPATGNFVCVMRCGLSGDILGPPNHNSFAEQVDRMHKTRFPQMSSEAYRQQLESVHDEALISEWKEASRTRTRYRLKGSNGDGEPWRWARAASHYLTAVAPKQSRETRRASVGYATLAEGEDRQIAELVSAALRREQRAPRSLTIAIRGALRHKQFHLFKAGSNIVFVTATKPTPLDPATAVESIREVLAHLREKPGCSRPDLVKSLRPGATAQSPEAAEILTPLSWLAERGHIIEFYNGALAVPLSGKKPRT